MFLTWTMPLGSLSIVPLDMGVLWGQKLAKSRGLYLLDSVSEDHLPSVRSTIPGMARLQ